MYLLELDINCYIMYYMEESMIFTEQRFANVLHAIAGRETFLNNGRELGYLRSPFYHLVSLEALQKLLEHVV